MAQVSFDNAQTKQEALREAAWRLEDTLTRAVVIDVYPTSKEARDDYLKTARAEVWYGRALLGLLMISIFETPQWCAYREQTLTKELSEECSSTSGSTLLLSGLPYLPLAYSLVLESLSLLLLARCFFLQRLTQTRHFQQLEQNYYGRRPLFGLVCVFLNLLECVIVALTLPRFRLAFVFRTALFCLLPAIVSLSKLVYSCLWEFYSIAAFLIGAIVTFAWVGRTIFADMSGGSEPFRTFPKSIYSMFVAGVSEDFIGIFLRSYTDHRWMGIVWLVFMAIVHVLLLSLVLDTLVAAYMVFSEQHAEEVAMHKVKGMLKSFRVLTMASPREATDEIGVAQEDFLAFVHELTASPRIRPMTDKDANFVFQAVDADGSGTIDSEEFCGICRVLQYRFFATRHRSRLATWCPKLWQSAAFQRFRVFVEGEDGEIDEEEEALEEGTLEEDLEPRTPPGLDRLMNYVLFLNLSLVVIETSYDLDHLPEPTIFDWLELIFSFVYLGEVIAKLMIVSFGEYWSYSSNVFDFVSTWLLLGTSLLESFLPNELDTYANMLRLLRLCRVVKQLKKMQSVQFMVRTITKLLMTAQEMVTMLGVVVFFFAMLSVQTLGGELYADNPKLRETEYLEQHMEALNANDFCMAFGVWVVFLLQEYQPAFPDAVSQVSDFPYTWLIFPTFYVVGVSIVFELVKAFTIEVFITLFKERSAEHHKRKKKDAFERCLENFRISLRAQGLILHIRELGDTPHAEEMREAFEKLQKYAAGKSGSLQRLGSMLALADSHSHHHHGAKHGGGHDGGGHHASHGPDHEHDGGGHETSHNPAHGSEHDGGGHERSHKPAHGHVA